MDVYETYGKKITDCVRVPITAADGVQEEIIAAPAAGQRTLLMALFGVVAGDATVLLEKIGGTNETGTMAFLQGGGIALPHTGYPHLWTDSAEGIGLLATGSTFDGFALVLTVSMDG